MKSYLLIFFIVLCTIASIEQTVRVRVRRESTQRITTRTQFKRELRK